MLRVGGLGRLVCPKCLRYSGSTLGGRTRARSKSDTSELLMPSTLGNLRPLDHSPLVEAYSTQGFTIRGNRVMGSVALLPRALLHWKVSKFEDITPESFTLFHLVQPKLDLIVLGTGSKVQRVPTEVYEYLRRHRISLEVQDTPNACATFNFCLDEGRPAGAALIPPEHIAP